MVCWAMTQLRLYWAMHQLSGLLSCDSTQINIELWLNIVSFELWLNTENFGYIPLTPVSVYVESVTQLSVILSSSCPIKCLLLSCDSIQYYLSSDSIQYSVYGVLSVLYLKKYLYLYAKYLYLYVKYVQRSVIGV